MLFRGVCESVFTQLIAGFQGDLLKIDFKVIEINRNTIEMQQKYSGNT